MVRALAESAPGHPEIERIVAPNPGPMTLEGTNTYVVSTAEGVYVIDPGPADAGHVAAVREAAGGRGELRGVLLTHSHSDHSEAVAPLGAPLLWGRVASGDELAEAQGSAGGPPADDPPARIGPFALLPTPGHAIDHVCFLLGGVCFCGDLVLGHGSTIVPPGGGSLAAYLDSLRALAALEPELLCPGHGPYVTEPGAKIAEYLAHRLERERKLLTALASGERSRERLLDRAWDDVTPQLRPAAAYAMQAHLDKLAAEDRVALAELVD